MWPTRQGGYPPARNLDIALTDHKSAFLLHLLSATIETMDFKPDRCFDSRTEAKTNFSDNMREQPNEVRDEAWEAYTRKLPHLFGENVVRPMRAAVDGCKRLPYRAAFRFARDKRLVKKFE